MGATTLQYHDIQNNKSMRNLIYTAAIIATTISACGPKQAPENQEENKTPMVDSRNPEWAKTANIYEVNIRQYTPEGTFVAFQKHLDRLEQMGVEILWFMPIQPIGKERRKGSLGSYYAIADYTAINPEFGTLEDFKALVADAQSRGMRVILDWVANHTAFDHKWIAQHPDWYTRNAKGQIVSPEADWSDVADLNYENPEMRAAMIADMTYWLTEVGIDGFRCDVAFMVPTAFWNDARMALDAAKPGLFMLAEADHIENELLGQAFNADYAWDLHHIMNAVAKGEKNVAAFETYREKLNMAYDRDVMKMAFTTNHDENSWNGTVFERMGDAHKTYFVLAATWSHTIPLIYSGQEAGLNKRLRFFEKDTINWERQDLLPFYTAMLALKKNNAALWNGNYGGDFELLSINPETNTYAYKRHHHSGEVVVYLNFSNQTANITTENAPLTQAHEVYLTSGDVVYNLGNPTVQLPAYGFLIAVK
jgi:glycosidase